MNSTPKNVAELKRVLQLGQKIICISFNDAEPSERMKPLGFVSKVQTNGVYITRLEHTSWLDFPRASEYTPLEDGMFKITFGLPYEDMTPTEIIYKLISE